MTITAPDPATTGTKRVIPKFVSVDDHVIEPASVWQDRLPAKYKAIGPRLERLRVANLQFNGMQYSFDIVDNDSTDGKFADFWCYEDLKVPMRRIITAVGFPPEERTMLPVTYDEMRKGCWDQAARLEDMDVNHTEASLCFPTFPRFCGQTFTEAKDRELAAALRPGLQRLDGRGVVRRRRQGPPHPADHRARSGTPSWRPPRCAATPPAACTPWPSPRSRRTSACRRSTPATGTRSSRPAPRPTRSSTCTSARRRGCRPPRPTPPPACRPRSASTTPWARSPTCSSPACWCATPTLKLAYSEGQIGWIPYILERADNVWKEYRGWAFDKDAVPEPPSTYFCRQVYGCFFRDNYGLKNLDDVGVDNVTFETDYPHSDSTWPDTKEVFRDMVGDLDDDDRLQAGPRQRHQDAVARPGLSVRGGGYRCGGGPLLRSSSRHLRCLPPAVPDRPGLLDRRRARHRHRPRHQRRPRRPRRPGCRTHRSAGAWRS